MICWTSKKLPSVEPVLLRSLPAIIFSLRVPLNFGLSENCNNNCGPSENTIMSDIKVSKIALQYTSIQTTNTKYKKIQNTSVELVVFLCSNNHLFPNVSLSFNFLGPVLFLVLLFKTYSVSVQHVFFSLNFPFQDHLH